MNRLIRRIIATGTLLMASPLIAQEPTDSAAAGPTLSQLKLDFDGLRASLMKPLVELDTFYRAQLEKLGLDCQNQGKLQQVIAVRSEQARLDGHPVGTKQ
ncbi:MAG: hypothetical protein KDM64_20320, partial [Verrucomicrobiae bacterium]|nr:hypothetical protein [Verrucomicrobiae bacterium]